VKSNFHWYLSNQDELVKEYNGKHLLLVDCGVAGAYDDHISALDAGYARFGKGNFSVQKCSPGDRDWRIHYRGPWFTVETHSSEDSESNNGIAWKQERSRQDRVADCRTRWRTSAS
jgi:hypothetical protein